MMKKKRHKEEKQINRKILKRKLYVYSSKKSKQTNKHITYYNGKWHCVYKIYVLPKVKANYYGNPLLYIISHFLTFNTFKRFFTQILLELPLLLLRLLLTVLVHYTQYSVGEISKSL